MTEARQTILFRPRSRKMVKRPNCLRRTIAKRGNASDVTETLEPPEAGVGSGCRYSACVPFRCLPCHAVTLDPLRPSACGLRRTPARRRHDTADGIPADPINVALIGTKAQVMGIMLAAKWWPADPLTFRSCLEIAEASVLKRPYDDAPVSNERLFGRKQDLAFEQPVGDNPRHRHHVRLWESDQRDDDGRPIWIGSAVFDERVGVSRTTGQVTHITAPDVDAERDTLFDDLKRTGDLEDFEVIRGFHKVLEGRNGLKVIHGTRMAIYIRGGSKRPIAS